MILLSLIFVLYLFSLHGRTNHPLLKNLRGWSYAHRGLHNKNFPENSMGAFRKAVAAGYGIELDVHLMADGNLAVIHDASLVRTVGKDWRIEDIALEELKYCTLIGSTETIPLLSDVLKMVDGRVPLIIELKPENGNHLRLAEAVCDMLDEYKGIFCLESFDPRAMRVVRKYRPRFVRGQLSYNSVRQKNKVPLPLRFVATHLMMNFLSVPDFIAYEFSGRSTVSNRICRRFWGMQGVTWTVRSEEDWRTAKDEGWIPIFENFEP